MPGIRPESSLTYTNVQLSGLERRPPACKDCGAGGLTRRAADERRCGVSVSDRYSPLITVRSGTPRARSCRVSGSGLTVRRRPHRLHVSDDLVGGAPSCLADGLLFRRGCATVRFSGLAAAQVNPRAAQRGAVPSTVGARRWLLSLLSASYHPVRIMLGRAASAQSRLARIRAGRP